MYRFQGILSSTTTYISSSISTITSVSYVTIVAPTSTVTVVSISKLLAGAGVAAAQPGTITFYKTVTAEASTVTLAPADPFTVTRKFSLLLLNTVNFNLYLHFLTEIELAIHQTVPIPIYISPAAITLTLTATETLVSVATIAASTFITTDSYAASTTTLIEDGITRKSFSSTVYSLSTRTNSLCIYVETIEVPIAFSIYATSLPELIVLRTKTNINLVTLTTVGPDSAITTNIGGVSVILIQQKAHSALLAQALS